MPLGIEPELEIELAKVAPEAHRERNTDYDTVWCPWAYKTVKVVGNHRNWPICSGCLRPIDLANARGKKGS
jgi:hypothetical protein